MNAHEVTISASDGGSFGAYLALPTKNSGSGIVVIQEIFGINSVMREIADSYAKAGYMALVPDLFWRHKPGIQLSDQTESDLAQAFELYSQFSEDKGVQDLAAALNFLRNHPDCSGKVGSVGYCLGGKLAYLMATRADADCNVSYYGVGIEKNLKEADNIKEPLMLHIAEQDEFVNPTAQTTIKTELSSNPLVTIYTYPGVGHAFARVGGNPYHQSTADLANSRTLDFLKQHLS